MKLTNVDLIILDLAMQGYLEEEIALHLNNLDLSIGRGKATAKRVRNRLKKIYEAQAKEREREIETLRAQHMMELQYLKRRMIEDGQFANALKVVELTMKLDGSMPQKSITHEHVGTIGVVHMIETIRDALDDSIKEIEEQISPAALLETHTPRGIVMRLPDEETVVDATWSVLDDEESAKHNFT